MTVTKVAAGENGSCFEDDAAGGQDVAREFSRLMLGAIHGSLTRPQSGEELEQSFLKLTGGKSPSTDRPYSQLELDLIHDLAATAESLAGKPEMNNLAAIVNLVSELLDNGGMTENQRQAVASILAALRDGTSTPEAAANAIAALGKLSKDGFTEVDAEEIKRLLTSSGPDASTRAGGADNETAKPKPLDSVRTADAHGEETTREAVAGPPAAAAAPAQPPPPPSPSPSQRESEEPAAAGTLYADTLAGNQHALQDALVRRGATPEELRLAMGIQLVESSDGISHDAGKDGNTDGSRNFSPLNMNEQALKTNWSHDDLASLNRPHTTAQWDRVADAYLSCVRAEGEPAFIHHLRDGYGEGRPDTTSAYMKGLDAQRTMFETQGAGARANVHVDHI